MPLIEKQVLVTSITHCIPPYFWWHSLLLWYERQKATSVLSLLWYDMAGDLPNPALKWVIPPSSNQDVFFFVYWAVCNKIPIKSKSDIFLLPLLFLVLSAWKCLIFGSNKPKNEISLYNMFSLELQSRRAACNKKQHLPFKLKHFFTNILKDSWLHVQYCTESLASNEHRTQTKCLKIGEINQSLHK